jgi:hypothetical protein
MKGSLDSLDIDVGERSLFVFHQCKCSKFSRLLQSGSGILVLGLRCDRV